MNWKYKALLQHVFSTIPCGERFNYIFQRCVTKSLPMSDEKFVSIVLSTKEHIEFINKYCHKSIREATFYEFGVGWDIIIPLTFYAFGVERQILVDIRDLLRFTLVNDTVRKFQRMSTQLELPRKLEVVLSKECTFPSSLNEYYGIQYIAPCDARNTGLGSGSIDFITSTNTLEHIPHQDIEGILRESHRLLKDDGLMSFRIDYKDHYSYFDRNISIYNFLQYSDKKWSLFNPKLHYQNRLRHKDYLYLFNKMGFSIVDEQVKRGNTFDLEIIEQLPIDDRFKSYSTDELAVREAHVVLKKQVV